MAKASSGLSECSVCLKRDCDLAVSVTFSIQQSACNSHLWYVMFDQGQGGTSGCSVLISAILSRRLRESNGQPQVPFEGKSDNIYLHIHPYCAQGLKCFDTARPLKPCICFFYSLFIHFIIYYFFFRSDRPAGWGAVIIREPMYALKSGSRRVVCTLNEQ